MKKLLVIGATGLVGSKVTALAPKFGLESYCTHNARKGSFSNAYKLDVTNRDATLDLVNRIEPDAIIHTAALHNVDYCEIHKEQANQVNVEGTRNVVDAAARAGSMVVYLSTDYVFDGEKGLYAESDEPNPRHHYAWTKLEGERIVSRMKSSAIARPSVIYGWNSFESAATPSSSGKTLNFAMFALEKFQKGEKVRAVDDQLSSPTFADNLSEALLRIVVQKASGIFHTAGRSCMSRFEFAGLVAKTFGYPASMVEPVSTSELKQLAKRPQNSCLSVGNAEKTLGMRFLTVEEGLTKMKDDLALIPNMPD